MTKICVCGAFRLWDIPKGGQEIKTNIIASVLEKKFNKISLIDTLAKYSRICMPFQLLWAMITSTDIIIMPAQNGLLILSRFLTILNKLFHRRLHYVVIGGWLPNLLPEHRDVIEALRKFKGIYVETHAMKIALERLDLTNTCVVPNCKPLSIIPMENMPNEYFEPYKLVTFSRVTETKGIGDAIDVVIRLNEKLGREVFTLDIYGPIDSGEDELWFAEHQKHFSSAVSYKGNAPFDKSVEILSGYFALLFPTYYSGEGFAGTLLDAFAAGVPIIASDWKYNAEIVDDGLTGKIFKTKNILDFELSLMWVYENKDLWVKMKRNCIEKAVTYLPESSIQPLIERIIQ